MVRYVSLSTVLQYAGFVMMSFTTFPKTLILATCVTDGFAFEVELDGHWNINFEHLIGSRVDVYLEKRLYPEVLGGETIWIDIQQAETHIFDSEE